MLAAPVINGTLPAFYLENGIAEIAIPFSMNRAVNKSEIKDFSLKLKNVQGSSFLLTKLSDRIDYVNRVIYFKLLKEDLENKFYTGLFYKAQLAYVDQNDSVGYYSTVGVLKYTTKPEVFILGLKKSLNNGHTYEYTGTYNQNGKDTTEKVYSYKFIVSDNNDNIIEDTDWLIHNNSTDINQYESYDKFFFERDLLEGEKFRIQYKVRTNNNLEINSPSYKITSKKTVISNLNNTKIIVNLNYDNAYINIDLDGEKDKYGYEIPISGYYVLSRSSEESNYTQWDEIDRFTLAGQRPSKKNWKDFTIEQGKKYKYSIQQYNNQGLFSERVYSDVIYSDFEDIFLYDGNRQLKIKFNPKISSFKIDQMESKVDTLGSKYPFIFRNGNVEYKEFSISGLISYYSDEEGIFLFKDYNLFNQEERKLDYVYRLFEFNNYKHYKKSYQNYYIKYLDNYYSIEEGYSIIQQNNEYKKSQYNIYQRGKWDSIENEDVYNFFIKYLNGFYKKFTKTTNVFNTNEMTNLNLTSNNIYLEREFKLEALNWLTNGKPKLFKSPTEGNYVIRLMNVSLSPIDSLGRMIHTFNSTAYEVADNNYSSLVNYNIINPVNDNPYYMKYISIPLMLNIDDYNNFYHINYQTVNQIKYAYGELVPNNTILNNFSINDVMPGSKIIVDNQEIIIGATGSYSSTIPVSSIIIPESQYLTGQINLNYKSEISNSFNNILTTDIIDIYRQQFIGKYKNIINEIENIETNLLTFTDIKAFLRPLDFSEGDNPLYGYCTVIPANSNSNIPLMRIVDFKNVGNSDVNNLTYRDLSIRSASNPMIMDIQRDYSLLLASNKLCYIENGQIKNAPNQYQSNLIYCLEQPYTQVRDGKTNEIYMLDDDYDDFLNFIETYKQDDVELFKNTYKRWDSHIEIRQKKLTSTIIDLKDSKTINLKDFSDIESLQISSGVYLEVSYQKQIIQYDLSKNQDLKDLKENLDTDKYLLSKDGMEEYLLNNDNNEELYAERISGMVNNVNNKNQYNDYINKLELYLNQLNKGV